VSAAIELVVVLITNSVDRTLHPSPYLRADRIGGLTIIQGILLLPAQPVDPAGLQGFPDLVVRTQD
jgi:hypothetical protein